MKEQIGVIVILDFQDHHHQENRVSVNPICSPSVYLASLSILFLNISDLYMTREINHPNFDDVSQNSW